MKRWVIILVIVLESGFQSMAQRFGFDQLPAAVQKTVSERKGPDRIKAIEFEARNGISAYVVEFARRGFNPKLVVAPDGSIIEDHRLHVPTAKDEQDIKWDMPEIGAKLARLSQLPAPVRNRIARERQGRSVGRIKAKPYGEQTVFVVEFKQSGP